MAGGLFMAAAAGAFGCDSKTDAGDSKWEALLADGDLGAMPAGARTPPPTMPPPPRFCGDCTREPLAFWMLDDCNSQSAELNDSAFTSPIRHPAFRSVSAACAASVDGQGVRLANPDDVVYAPDQPDFVFDQGLTIAAWINPDKVTGTQTIARKRLDGTSAFVLAIDGKKLSFAVKLANGRSAGVTAPIQAEHFTHVAGTHDGKEVVLYVNGAVAGRVKAAGKLAAGAGPIFVGNDADGRQLKGIVDDIWLNTLAAPADAIKSLNCVRKPPVASFTPATTPPTPAGTTVAFDLAVQNPNGAECPADSFQFFGALVPYPLSANPGFGFLTVAPGATGHATVSVTSDESGPTGPVTFQYVVASASNFALQTSAQATYVVAPAAPASQTGCAAAMPPPVAPGGYFVNGNTICTAAGRAHQLHGVDRPSLEWLTGGANISPADFQLMKTWNANVVRIGLNQDFWLSASPLADPNYPLLVDDAIQWAEQAGMDVILDLHWSDAGVLGGCAPSSGCQQVMPDLNSITFWSEVAARYKGDGRVMFELYNEPHDVSWEVWQLGGDTGFGFRAAGMQQLYDAVRAAGAHNLVLIGGLNWAYDLSGVPSHRIAGYNITYATHPYTDVGRFTRPPSDWGRAFGSLTRTDPVVATEFGVLNDTACSNDYHQQVIAYTDAHFMSWTAWAWFPGGCLFPNLIDDWAATPSATGGVVKAALLAYADPPASPPLPGGTSVFGYAFDHSAQGWTFNRYDDPNMQNLAIHPPAGGTVPTLRVNATDGDPSPGALQLTVGFTAFDQYVDVGVDPGFPGLDLTGKTLHARIRLVSGSFPQGAFQFHAATGASFNWGAAFFGADALPVGAWVPVDLELAAVTTPGFDPAHVVQIGVQFLSGFSSGGGTFVPTGDTVFEIDTVTD